MAEQDTTLWVTGARYLADGEVSLPGEVVSEGTLLTDPEIPLGRAAFVLEEVSVPTDPVAQAAELGIDIEEYHQG